LPPITFQQYDEEIDKPVASQLDALNSEASNSNVNTSNATSAKPLPEEDPSCLQCLFCPVRLTDLEENLEHMLSEHGLFVPEPKFVTDLETFILYLSSTISQYHECLYCGTERNSLAGVHQHMRDRGHCMLNFDREPELLEFWDFGGSDGDDDNDDEKMQEQEGLRHDRNPGTSWAERVANVTRLSETEMQLPSGMVVKSRTETPHDRSSLPSKRRTAIKKARMRAIAASTTTTEDDTALGEHVDSGSTRGSLADDRRVVRRGELGLVGVSEQQRRALLVTEKKMQKQEAVKKAAYSWVTQRVANKQKFYRPAGPMRPLG